MMNDTALRIFAGGDEGSERALQEVATLLEKEVARGAISPEVEKKLLGEWVLYFCFTIFHPTRKEIKEQRKNWN